MSMGGRAADRLVIGEPLSGAMMDLKQATRIARLMVTQLGMSERLGPVYYQIGEDHVFLGKEIVESRTFSEGTAAAHRRGNPADPDGGRAEGRRPREGESRQTRPDRGSALLVHEELDRSEFENLLAGVPIADLRQEAKLRPVPAHDPVVTPNPYPEPPPKPGLAFGGA